MDLARFLLRARACDSFYRRARACAKLCIDNDIKHRATDSEITYTYERDERENENVLYCTQSLAQNAQATITHYAKASERL